MLQFVRQLFDTSDFPARWYCGDWSTAHGYTHIAADLTIGGAYFAIPVLLAWFIMRRRDTPFQPIFVLFVAFIFFCGLGHLIEASIFYRPWYRLSALVKVCTALTSCLTVAALLPVLPRALRLPGLAVVNAELERSNAELDRFAYIASHDLREPLRSVDHLSTWIAEDLGAAELPETTRRHLLQLRQQVGRMETLLDDLLAYSRAGREAEDVFSVDTGRLIGEIVSLLDVPETLQVVVDEPLPVFRAAKVPLETCLRNLIGNAIKHHDRTDGEVRISARETDDYVELIVADDGPGIAPEYHDRIFEVFQTLRPRDECEGSGIGLAIVKKIAEAHGGEIFVDSSESHGAVFRLRWIPGK